MTIQTRIREMLQQHAELRSSYNRIVFGYWVVVDGYGTLQKDFDQLTPAETILREARIVYANHPELSPIANPSTKPFEQYVADLFPVTR